MSRIVVVEDSSTQALEIQMMLEDAGHEVVVAANGRVALRAIELAVPDLVLTDLRMPELDGLQLVRAIRALNPPTIPVVLMTAHGSEDIAAEALRCGAASYVPKRRLAQDLLRTVADVLAIAGRTKADRRGLSCWSATESHYVLENDPAMVPGLIGHLSDNLARMKLTDDTGLLRLSIALSEVIGNAIYHGNLEVSSTLREGSEENYEAQADARRHEPPYRDRRVYLTERETPSGVTFVVRDEGPGFNPSAQADPRDPANLEKASGRGLLLIRAFMDEVSFNDAGNEITITKRREPPAPRPS